MGVQQSKMMAALEDFLSKLKADRKINICNADISSAYILSRINLSGTEDRPFTDEEIQAILSHYGRFVGKYLIKKGLWILPIELPEKEKEGESDVQKKAIDFRRNHQKLLSALLEKGYEGLTDEEKRYWNNVY